MATSIRQLGFCVNGREKLLSASDNFPTRHKGENERLVTYLKFFTCSKDQRKEHWNVLANLPNVLTNLGNV
jgi:hypothetical protein